MRPSDALSKYDEVLTIPTAIGEVPLYKLIEKYFLIEDKDGNTVETVLNEPQCQMYAEMCEQRLAGEPVRLDVLKARQLGASTFIHQIIFSYTIFVPGQKAAVVADIAEHAANLFDKYNFTYDHLPEELKPRKIKSNARELVVAYGDKKTARKSSIRIMVQGERAGRSGTYQYLHLSECAFWDNLHDTLVSLLQTVSNTNKNSMVFLETTANGINEYKRRWDLDWGGGGKSRYRALFFGWFSGSDYAVKDEDLRPYPKPHWLEELQVKEKLSENQCQWYYEKFIEFDEDLDKLKQEFPSNPVEAFITSGNSVFNSELVQKRKLEIIENVKYKQGYFTYKAKYSEDGERITVLDIEFVESKIGSIKIFKNPEPGHPYIANNDPANGGEDYFAIQVFDNYTGKQVARYRKNKVDADDCAFQMYCLLRYYNGALSESYSEDMDDTLANGETNTTSYILETVRKCGYRNIYQDQDVQDLSNRYINKLGYMTKTNNRQYMIDLFKIAFRKNPEIISDYETICEMENFEIVKHAGGKEKSEAANGSHDDLVMACCGVFLSRGSQRSYVKDVGVYKKTTSIDELDARVTANQRRIRAEREERDSNRWDW